MSTQKKQDSFWTSYADLMTSLFFVMFVLFIVCLAYVGGKNIELNNANAQLEEQNTTYENILGLQEQFQVLSKSTHLAYDEEKKMFYVPDFQGKEIFQPHDDKIKDEYIETVNEVGQNLEEILSELNSGKNFHYQLVIEGTAAIPYDSLIAKTYNPDEEYDYFLSYRRALALYMQWNSLNIDLRKYNTEIIIAGSGFNGNNRDTKREDNNKRFVIQIIPKIERPEDTSVN